MLLFFKLILSSSITENHSNPNTTEKVEEDAQFKELESLEREIALDEKKIETFTKKINKFKNSVFENKENFESRDVLVLQIRSMKNLLLSMILNLESKKERLNSLIN